MTSFWDINSLNFPGQCSESEILAGWSIGTMVLWKEPRESEKKHLQNADGWKRQVCFSSWNFCDSASLKRCGLLLVSGSLFLNCLSVPPGLFKFQLISFQRVNSRYLVAKGWLRRSALKGGIDSSPRMPVAIFWGFCSGPMLIETSLSTGISICWHHLNQNFGHTALPLQIHGAVSKLRSL